MGRGVKVERSPCRVLLKKEDLANFPFLAEELQERGDDHHDVDIKRGSCLRYQCHTSFLRIAIHLVCTNLGYLDWLKMLFSA